MDCLGFVLFVLLFAVGSCLFVGCLVDYDDDYYYIILLILLLLIIIICCCCCWTVHCVGCYSIPPLCWQNGLNMLKVVVVQPCPGVGAGWVAKQFSTPSSPAYINLWY